MASGPPQAAYVTKAKHRLAVLVTRDDDPTPESPLTYRERAYLMPEGMRVTEAETELREALSEFQAGLSTARKGKFVNLAVFDHPWEVEPERPPVVVLEWRDWRGDAVVDYPGRLMHSARPESATAGDAGERLTALFEDLQGLHACENGVVALRLGLSLLTRAVPCEAAAGALYDINVDELRLVAAEGAATSLQGRGLSARRGILGRGFESERPLVVQRPEQESDFDPEVDSWGVGHVRSMLVRSLHHRGARHGVLVLINRTEDDHTFSDADGNLVNYLADRLADTLDRIKRRRS